MIRVERGAARAAAVRAAVGARLLRLLLLVAVLRRCNDQSNERTNDEEKYGFVFFETKTRNNVYQAMWRRRSPTAAVPVALDRTRRSMPSLMPANLFFKKYIEFRCRYSVCYWIIVTNKYPHRRIHSNVQKPKR